MPFVQLVSPVRVGTGRQGGREGRHAVKIGGGYPGGGETGRQTSSTLLQLVKFSALQSFHKFSPALIDNDDDVMAASIELHL